MTTLREAAAMALDALEAHADIGIKYKAIFALHEALAQPEPEPVGYIPVYELSRLQSGHDGRLRSAKFGASALDGDVAVYTAPPPQRQPLTLEIRKPNESGSTLVTARWFVDTPHGWIGAWDREALEYVVNEIGAKE